MPIAFHILLIYCMWGVGTDQPDIFCAVYRVMSGLGRTRSGGRGRGRSQPTANANEGDGLVAVLAHLAQAIDRMPGPQHDGNPNAGLVVPQQLGLTEFCKRDPPSFHGNYDPMAAERWVKHLEKIFRAMQCTDEQKVIFAAYKLEDEAEHWWEATHPRLLLREDLITWETFKTTFMLKYFPANVRIQKE